MRIGLMLRAYGERGGVGVYTRNLVRELIGRDERNEYVLYFREPVHLGQYGHLPTVRERVLPVSNPFLWDQFAVPRACRQDAVNVVFHPKFTAPLLAPCKAVMVVHGADWFIPEQAQYYRPWDVRYVRLMMPLYFRKCARVISVSQLTTDNFYAVLNVPPGKIETVYFGPAPHFKPVSDPGMLAEVRERYGLPERYMLTLTKPDGDRRKNFGKILEAYGLYHARSDAPVALVVVGHEAGQFRGQYGLLHEPYGSDIHFTGWVEQADMPAVYSMAELFLYPSNLEAFPIPITEAMTCGTPIVTSHVNGLEEIAGEAALLVDPSDAEAIACAVEEVLGDLNLHEELSLRGLQRAKRFTWRACGSRVMELLSDLQTSGA